jgi:tRNA(Ile)-lysidine synthase
VAAGATVPRLAVAVSGGIDSTALLHCTARLAAGQRVEVHALHVHHGLHPQADAWMAQVAAQCARWRPGGTRIHFHGHRLTRRPLAGDSIEAWARRERYAALSAMAREAGCAVVLLAHHRRDQAETVLLQALRGAGPAGLSAMPREALRDDLTWVRPWLHHPRQAIEAYARRWRLAFVSDPANADDRHARSRLRQRLWPSLLALFPDAETTLDSVARRAQEARALIDEVATADAAQVMQGGTLQIGSWLALSPPRRAAVLRRVLPVRMGAPLPESLLQRLLVEVPAAGSGRWPGPGGEWRCHRGALHWVPELPQAGAAAIAIDLARTGRHRLAPWPGTLCVDATDVDGLPLQALQRAELRPRVGGEQFQRHAAGPARLLKKQFQSQGVPPWARDVPMLYVDGQLVFVPGLGLDARVLSWPGRPRVTLRWEP